MPDDDLTVSTALDKAARQLGRAIYRFRRLPVGRKTAVVAVLVVAVIGGAKACNALVGSNGSDGPSFRGGWAYGYQVGLVHRGMGGPPPAENDISAVCVDGARISAANGYGWVEGGVSYDIRGADVDSETFSDGCVEGFKAGRRGDPAP